MLAISNINVAWAEVQEYSFIMAMLNDIDKKMNKQEQTAKPLSNSELAAFIV